MYAEEKMMRAVAAKIDGPKCSVRTKKLQWPRSIFSWAEEMTSIFISRRKHWWNNISHLLKQPSQSTHRPTSTFCMHKARHSENEFLCRAYSNCIRSNAQRLSEYVICILIIIYLLTSEMSIFLPAWNTLLSPTQPHRRIGSYTVFFFFFLLTRTIIVGAYSNERFEWN